jgi:hypothetical protein
MAQTESNDATSGVMARPVLLVLASIKLSK